MATNGGGGGEMMSGASTSPAADAAFPFILGSFFSLSAAISGACSDWTPSVMQGSELSGRQDKMEAYHPGPDFLWIILCQQVMLDSQGDWFHV
jgi:hypothetical protein